MRKYKREYKPEKLLSDLFLAKDPELEYFWG
jgi:hypothetical protein